MNGLEKIVARMEADTQAACDALAASAAENAAAILRDCQAQADAVTRDSAQRAEAQAAEHLEGFYLAGEIEEGGWLVQDDDAGLLRQGFGYHYLLTFTIAQFADVSLSQMLNAGFLKSCGNNLFVGSR